MEALTLYVSIFEFPLAIAYGALPHELSIRSNGNFIDLYFI